MYLVLKKNWDRTKYLILSGLCISLLLLVAVLYKSDEKITRKSELINNSNQSTDLKIFKEFLLKQIRSPFINLNYEIKKGDTIEKILTKYKVQNSDIQTVINKYKKYGKPNQLLIGNKIDIIIKKNISTNKNSVIKFSVPISKSTSISITKNEENKIVSKKNYY